MRVQLDIPDALILLAQDAAADINNRLTASQRRPDPLDFTPQDALMAVLSMLQGLVTQNISEQATEAAEAGQRTAATRLDQYISESVAIVVLDVPPPSP